jgi:hypothetical protein
LHFGFTEQEGLIGYLDRISALLMALADFSGNPLHIYINGGSSSR